MKIRIELLIASLATKIRSGDLRQGPNLEADLRRTIAENELKEPQPAAVADALALVDAGPLMSAEWLEASIPMCKHCEAHEDVDQAAARILASELRRVTT